MDPGASSSGDSLTRTRSGMRSKTSVVEEGSTSDTQGSGEASNCEPQEDTPRPRKRGRPRKPRPEGEADAPPKKRGRPSKLTKEFRPNTLIRRRNASTELMEASLAKLERIPKEGASLIWENMSG